MDVVPTDSTFNAVVVLIILNPLTNIDPALSTWIPVVHVSITHELQIIYDTVNVMESIPEAINPLVIDPELILLIAHVSILNLPPTDANIEVVIVSLNLTLNK